MDITRRRYLEAMGIQLWELRRPPGRIAIAAPMTCSVAGTTEDSLSPPSAAETLAAAKAGEAEERVVAQIEDNEVERSADLFAGNERSQCIARLDWEALQLAVSGCTACSLHATRTQTVFGVGDRQASWMVIGEAPGADEDRLGEPFVGRAGKLLDAMLFALGLQRGEVYIANILKCRPPNNRDPLPEEAQCCRPFLERQIALVRPKIILAVGRIAAQHLLHTDVPMNKLRGRVYRVAGIPLVVTYHPAYLLRSPREKGKAWEDLLLARRTLAAAGAKQEA